MENAFTERNFIFKDGLGEIFNFVPAVINKKIAVRFILYSDDSRVFVSEIYI